MPIEMSFVVNKSGSTIPVYDNSEDASSRTQIGSLYPRETYILAAVSEYSGYEVWFRNSSGKYRAGFLNSNQPTNWSKYIEDYPYNSVQRQLYCRVSRTVYNSVACSTAIATVPAGNCIKLYNSSLTHGPSEAYFDFTNSIYEEGYLIPKHMCVRVSSYQTSSGWKTPPSGTKAYVDVSLNVSSSYSGIKVYGSW